MLNLTAQQLEALNECRQAAEAFFALFASPHELAEAERILLGEAGLCAESARDAITGGSSNENSLDSWGF